MEVPVSLWLYSVEHYQYFHLANLIRGTILLSVFSVLDERRVPAHVFSILLFLYIFLLFLSYLSFYYKSFWILQRQSFWYIVQIFSQLTRFVRIMFLSLYILKFCPQLNLSLFYFIALGFICLFSLYRKGSSRPSL